MKLRHVHHRKFDKLICAISIICLAVVLVLVLVLKGIFQVLVLVLVLGVRSLSLFLSLGVWSRRSLFLSWFLGVRSLLTSLVVCCSVSSSSSIPFSLRTLSLVFFSVHDFLSIFLHIRISHALIFF